MKKLFDLGEKIKKSFDEAFPEQKEAMKSIPFSNDEKHSISFEEAKDVAEHPLQNLLFPQIFATIPLLIKLDFCVLEADSQTGFITSDNPCVWYDPEGYKRHPHYRAPALMYPSIEITMPISPKQLILLNRKSINGNIKIDENKVDEFNRRTRFNCYHYFVVNSKIKKSHWFWKGVEPNDSWEKLNKSEKQT